MKWRNDASEFLGGGGGGVTEFSRQTVDVPGGIRPK